MMGWHTMLDLIEAGPARRISQTQRSLSQKRRALRRGYQQARKGDAMDRSWPAGIDRQHTVQFVRILPGPIEKIWDYLADGEKRGEWFAAGAMPAQGRRDVSRCASSIPTCRPTSAPPPESMAEMDKNGHTSSNILLACEPPHRAGLHLRRRETTRPRSSEVEFVLSQEGDNKVRLTLTHSKIPDRDYRRRRLRRLAQPSGHPAIPRRGQDAARLLGRVADSTTAFTTSRDVSSALRSHAASLASGSGGGNNDQENTRRRDYRACLSFCVHAISSPSWA